MKTPKNQVFPGVFQVQHLAEPSTPRERATQSGGPVPLVRLEISVVLNARSRREYNPELPTLRIHTQLLLVAAGRVTDLAGCVKIHSTRAEWVAARVSVGAVAGV